MRKLQILKSLVDFIWIVTCIPLLIIMPFGAVYLFFNADVINIVFDQASLGESTPEYAKLILGLLIAGISLVSIYCLYLFRKTLRYFQQVKPFHLSVIKNFDRIGYLLTGIGVIASVFLVIGRAVFKNQLKIQLGLSPYLLLICLGLFFLVLSEIFTVAKHAKEENELTI